MIILLLIALMFFFYKLHIKLEDYWAGSKCICFILGSICLILAIIYCGGFIEANCPPGRALSNMRAKYDVLTTQYDQNGIDYTLAREIEEYNGKLYQWNYWRGTLLFGCLVPRGSEELHPIQLAIG